MPIAFYTIADEYGAFSNFSPHGVEMDRVWWPTVEHYFQAMKFHDDAYRQRIRGAHDPMKAKMLGQTRKVPLRDDWELVKEDVMLAACLKKFQTHAEPRELLLSTGDEELIENAPGDYYWGCGKAGTGKNRLGHILMQVRLTLRESMSASE